MANPQRAAGLLPTFAILCGLTAPAAAQVTTETLNPTGGTTAGSGLRIAVTLTRDAGNASTFLQVFREDSAQFYAVDPLTQGDARAYLGIGPAGSGTAIGVDEFWSSEGATLSAVRGSGTATDPWRTTLVLQTRAGDNAGFTLSQEVAYVAGEDTFLLTYTVTPPFNNIQPIRLYHRNDTNVDDLSEGVAVVEPSVNPRVVGVLDDDPNDQFLGYLAVDDWQHFYSGECCVELDDAPDLDDTADSDPDLDRALGVQFDLGVITAPARVRFRMGFRGDACEEAAGGGSATPDTGCAAGVPACDEDSGACVGCRSDAFCTNGLACDLELQRCRVCDDDAAAAAMDRGCSASAPICDTSVDLGACYACADDQTGTAQDLGCSAAEPLCVAGDGTRECEACVDDALGEARDTGCPAGEPLCDTSGADASCALCLDTVNGAGTDTGCSGATPICSGDACLECVDDLPGSAVDSGCDSDAPLCDTSGGTPHCTACIDDGDCSGTTPVCDDSGAEAECVACIDDASGNDEDRGCAAAAPLCDDSGSSPGCVACIDSADGAEDQGCSGATPVCVSGTCRQCEDTATGNGQDFGCAAGSPVCDESGSAPVCVGCLGDDDCATGVCNTTTDTCQDCRDDQASEQDDGCSAAAPHCNTAGSAPTCVGCIDDETGDDADLGCSGDSPLCDDDANPPRCVSCFSDDDADEPDLGCDTALPVCAVNGLARSCVACADDQASGTPDQACTEMLPVCDVGGEAPECVFCLNDASGNAADNGCTDPAPYCDSTRDVPICVACIDDEDDTGVDFGCDGERSFCDASGDEPECVYCQDIGEANVDRGCTLVTPACVRVSGFSVCVECEDDHGPGETDFGCATNAPFCNADSALASCVECMRDIDCDAGLVCNDGHQCAPGCTDDGECSGRLGVCDEEQRACANCTDDNTSACATSPRGHVCVNSLCGCKSDVDCESDQFCFTDGGVCVPRSIIGGEEPDPTEEPDAGVKDPDPDPDTDENTTEADPTQPPIVRIKGGSKCAAGAPGGGAAGIELAWLAGVVIATVRRRRGTRRPSK